MSPIYYSRNLRRSLLRRLARVPDAPTLADYEQHFRRPWVDSLLFNFDTPVDYMPDYSREIARAVGIAGLLLNLNFSPRQKEPLLVYLTQYGIDLSGLVRKRHPGWPAHGGHGSGRKFPILFAGTLLGNKTMTRAEDGLRRGHADDLRERLDRAKALYAGHYGVKGEGRVSARTSTSSRATGRATSARTYRRCCTSAAWIGEALAARLIRGIRVAWNHPAFFAYADRWMTEDDSQALATIRAQTGDDYSGIRQRKAWDSFVTNMWRRYRARG